MSDSKKIYGLIGYPVKHSLSPAMHNAAFCALGINAEYELFEVKPDELENFLVTLEDKNIYGLNVTIPHKVALLKNTTIRSNVNTELVGAINTIKRTSDNKLECYNTDYLGFRKSLIEELKFDPENKNALMIGCGGAGRAIVAGLSVAPKIEKVYIHDKNELVGKSAKNHFDKYRQILGYDYEFISEGRISQVINECQLLVNTSPVGMKDNDSSVINKDLLHGNLSVYDVVYNRETQLIKDAKNKGLAAVGGLGMLLYQGVEALKKWVGEEKVTVKIESVMREALEKEIKNV